MASPWTLTIDCSSPAVLARFWAETLGYEPAPVPAEDPWNNYCPNYSPTFVRTGTGHLLEITTAPTEEGVCRPWYGSLT